MAWHRGEVRWQGRLACETCLALLSENNTTTVHGSISSGTLGTTRSWGCWDGPAFETQGKMRLPKRGADPAPRLFFKRLSSVDHMAGTHAHPRPLFSLSQFWNRLSNCGFYPDFPAGPPLALPRYGGMAPIQTLIAQQNH